MKTEKNEFIKIVKESQGIINKICFGYTNNSEDRNDLHQEILIQLWKAYPKFSKESRLSTYIYRIALNTAISNFRKRKRNIEDGSLVDYEHQISETEDSREMQENLVQLYVHISRLNDLEKAIIMLYLEDQSYRDIAEIVGISETNVATKINRIKNKLKNQINNTKN